MATIPLVPLVLVPGIQGHWKYMRPTVAALAKNLRMALSSALFPNSTTAGTSGSEGCRSTTYWTRILILPDCLPSR